MVVVVVVVVVVASCASRGSFGGREKCSRKSGAKLGRENRARRLGNRARNQDIIILVFAI